MKYCFKPFIALILFSLLLSGLFAPALVNPPHALAATPEVACYPQSGTGKITGTVTAAGGGPLPVSYTHLDVYKRQVLERAGR